MIYDVIWSVVVLPEKLSFFNKQLWGFIISLRAITWWKNEDRNFRSNKFWEKAKSLTSACSLQKLSLKFSLKLLKLFLGNSERYRSSYLMVFQIVTTLKNFAEVIEKRFWLRFLNESYKPTVCTLIKKKSLNLM